MVTNYLIDKTDIDNKNPVITFEILKFRVVCHCYVCWMLDWLVFGTEIPKLTTHSENTKTDNMDLFYPGNKSIIPAFVLSSFVVNLDVSISSTSQLSIQQNNSDRYNISVRISCLNMITFFSIAWKQVIYFVFVYGL